MKKIIVYLLQKLGFDVMKYVNVGKSRRTKKLTYYETKTGNYYLPTDAVNDTIATEIKEDRVYDKEVVDCASKYVKPGTAVLDLGCNFGQMSIIFSNLAEGKVKVHSFEADDWVYEILLKNIFANKKEDVIIPHFGAVHNIDNKILYYPVQNFKKYQSYGSHGIDYTVSHGRKVKSLTIDSLDIKEPISFMKIDIEGGDLKAMQGARKTILKNKMPIIFEYQYIYEDKYKMCFQDYVDFVQSINYRFSKVINSCKGYKIYFST